MYVTPSRLLYSRYYIYIVYSYFICDVGTVKLFARGEGDSVVKEEIHS